MRVTVWILGDQLLEQHPALTAVAGNPDAAVTVLLVESAGRAARLPYHRKKLVLVRSAMRHYAAALRVRGYVVDYVQASTMRAGLREHVNRRQPDHIVTMAAAEYAGRRYQEERLAAELGVPVTVMPNTQLLVGRYDPFPGAAKRVVLEQFYRAMRRHWRLLLDDSGEPVGGAWNFDRENRRPLPRAGLALPAIDRCEPDTITLEVMAEVAALPGAAGAVDGFSLAVTHAQAAAALEQFIAERLASFGTYEDAMTHKSATVFHSLLSPYLNIGLLDPLTVAQRAEQAWREGRAPLNAVEGFVRQVVGWREYMYWQYWRLMPDLRTANHWAHTRAMPQLFWDGLTEMNCLRHVVGRVIADGYCHHIERLMVISNFCLLAGIDPAAVNHWFWSFYIDAYEWVVTPNVIGMGLYADGGAIATKPYVASANYIDRMSDYCAGCRYDPKARTGATACPFNFLYWNFLIAHEHELRSNPRLGPAVLGLRHLSAAGRSAVQAQAAEFLASLPAYKG